MSFDQVGLTPELLRAVAQQGYTEPTPVQLEAIPHVLQGRDVLAGAQTGTGKTSFFLSLIKADLEAGYGVIVIDPLGVFAKAALALVPLPFVAVVAPLALLARTGDR